MAPTYYQGSWSVHKAFLLKETKTTVTSPEHTQYIQTPAVTASIVTKAGLDCHISVWMSCLRFFSEFLLLANVDNRLRHINVLMQRSHDIRLGEV